MKNLKIQVKTRQEMAFEYGISERTFYRWLKKEQIYLPPGLITPRWQNVIYERFGKPEKAYYFA